MIETPSDANAPKSDEELAAMPLGIAFKNLNFERIIAARSRILTMALHQQPASEALNKEFLRVQEFKVEEDA